MDKESIKNLLVDLMRLCNKAMIHTTSGYNATYASMVGKETQRVYNNLDSFSGKELSYIRSNIIQYSDRMKDIIAAR